MKSPKHDTYPGAAINRSKFHTCMSSSFKGVKTNALTYTLKEFCFMA